MQQLHYMRSRNPGFEKENLIQIKALGVANTKQIFPILKHELSALPQIVRAAGTDNGLGDREGMNFTGFDYKGKSINIFQYYIDPDFIPTLGMHLLTGRNFDSMHCFRHGEQRYYKRIDDESTGLDTRK